MIQYPISVIAFGNPLRSDEGIGPRILSLLMQQAEKDSQKSGSPTQPRLNSSTAPMVRFVDLGTSGMRLFDEFAMTRVAILLDCAKMGETPGTIRRFLPGQASTRKQLNRGSYHDMDVLQLVDLARQLGVCPNPVVVFGIEPLTLDYSTRLSPKLEARVPEYAAIVNEEIRRWIP